MDYWNFLFVLIFFIATKQCQCVTEDPILASMTWSSENGYKLVQNQLLDSEETVAFVNFTNAINKTGWSYLEIKTSSQYPDYVQVLILFKDFFFFAFFKIIILFFFKGLFSWISGRICHIRNFIHVLAKYS